MPCWHGEWQEQTSVLVTTMGYLHCRLYVSRLSLSSCSTLHSPNLPYLLGVCFLEISFFFLYIFFFWGGGVGGNFALSPPHKPWKKSIARPLGLQYKAPDESCGTKSHSQHIISVKNLDICATYTWSLDGSVTVCVPQALQKKSQNVILFLKNRGNAETVEVSHWPTA